jgi:nicotinamide-nucleotide amidase
MDDASILLNSCASAGSLIGTAESCTGGLLSALLTSIPGSSQAFDRGFVTYTDLAKNQMLNISPDLIKSNGAVSKEVAVAMARGVLTHSLANLAVAITGIAGPSGATKNKPLGLVYIAAMKKNANPITKRSIFRGDRQSVRMQSVKLAIIMLRSIL